MTELQRELLKRVTTGVAADVLGVCNGTIVNMCRRGELRYRKTRGGRIEIDFSNDDAKRG